MIKARNELLPLNKQQQKREERAIWSCCGWITVRYLLYFTFLLGFSLAGVSSFWAVLTRFITDGFDTDQRLCELLSRFKPFLLGVFISFNKRVISRFIERLSTCFEYPVPERSNCQTTQKISRNSTVTRSRFATGIALLVTFLITVVLLVVAATSVYSSQNS